MWFGETIATCVNVTTQRSAKHSTKHSATDHLPHPAWSSQMLTATQRWLGVQRPLGSLDRSGSIAQVLSPDWLPIALLYHDQPQQMQQMQANPTAAVLGQTISLILRERFIAAELIPQIMHDLDFPPDLPLVQALLQVQNWLTQPADLAAIRPLEVAEAADLALTLSLYSFLSSPEYFQISLLRLHRIFQAVQPQAVDLALAGAMLGAVSGTYCGLSGSDDWQAARRGWPQLTWPQLTSAKAQAELDDWEQQLFQSADQLLRNWSGVHGPSPDAGSDQWLQQPHASLIAAPRVIRRL
jgi:hypothetical protein